MSDYRSYMWSVPDWRTDEMYTMLDNREQGIYRNLIDECWVTGSITADLAALARFSHEPSDYFLSVWEKIKHKFAPSESGSRFISRRLEQDRRRFMLTAKFKEKRAKKAANTRWDKHRANMMLHATSNATSSNLAMLVDAQTQTQKEDLANTKDLPNPLLVNPAPEAPRDEVLYSPDFEKFFWSVYPKKVHKKKAWDEWKKLHPTNGTREKIRSSVLAHMQTSQWKRENGQYIPGPERFLSRRQWEDELQTKIHMPDKPVFGG